MIILITILIIIATLLVLLTAVQNSKKEGLDGSLGNTGAGQLIGVKKTGDLLEQLTWSLIILLFSLSMTTNLWLKQKTKGLRVSPNIERAKETMDILEGNQANNKLGDTHNQQVQE
jgi:preprotein translocase subunit SecG